MVFSLLLQGAALGKAKSQNARTSQVSEILSDFEGDEGFLLSEAQELGVNLVELRRRLASLSTQAAVVGDGDMLACTEPLKTEATELHRTLSNVQSALLTAITEEDTDARGHNVILLDILVERAYALDMKKGDCMGSAGKIYVEVGNFEPRWGAQASTSRRTQRQRSSALSSHPTPRVLWSAWQ